MKRDELDRLPPNNVEAEAALLGVCLLDRDNEAITEAMNRLGTSPAGFWDIRHQAIWSALVDMCQNGKPADVIMLSDRLAKSGDLDRVGGDVYLAELANNAPAGSMAGYYAEIVWDAWLKRKVVSACTEAISAVYAHTGSTRELIDRVERDMIGLVETRAAARVISARDLMKGVIDELEQYHRGGAQLKGLATGFSYIDKMLAGLGPSEMIVIGGRPGEGKTALAMNIVEHVSVALRRPTAVFSLEMSSKSLGSRLLFQHAGADYQRYRTGFLENEAIPGLGVAAVEIGGSPLFVDDTPSMTIMELRANARMLRRKHGIELFVVDYFQLVACDRNLRDRQSELAEISKGLKGMAKDLDVPVVVVAALNRESERDGSRKPRLSDLREAGQLEYDADVVALLYKPKVDDEGERQACRQLGEDWSRRYWRANLLIAKQRNGPTGDCELLYNKASMRFESYVRTAATHVAPVHKPKQPKPKQQEMTV
jgi:replicative DNA helicase